MTTRPLPICLSLFAALALLLPCAASAQDAKTTPAPTTPLQTGPGDSVDKIVESFFGLLAKGQIDEAYDFLTQGTKIAEDLEEVATLKGKTKDAIKVFGDIRGYELITVQNAGTHLMKVTYLSLGTGSPLRWKFYFYRLDKTWKLIDIGVDDRLIEMFEEKPLPVETGTSAGR